MVVYHSITRGGQYHKLHVGRSINQGTEDTRITWGISTKPALEQTENTGSITVHHFILENKIQLGDAKNAPQDPQSPFSNLRPPFFIKSLFLLSPLCFKPLFPLTFNLLCQLDVLPLERLDASRVVPANGRKLVPQAGHLAELRLDLRVVFSATSLVGSPVVLL